MLHGTIRNDYFLRNRALQCWNNVVTIRNNVAEMLQRCVALKIVVAIVSCNPGGGLLELIFAGYVPLASQITHFSKIQLVVYYQCCVLID